MPRKLNRRNFVSNVVSAAGAGWWISSQSDRVLGQSPNEKVGVASIGVGGKGSSDTDGAARYSQIVAIDMNKGEHLWSIPNGDTPDRIKHHPALEGVDLPNTGRTSHAVTMVTKTLLITAEGGGGASVLHAVDKLTGERLGTVDIPAPGRYGMMSYLHEGQQYIVVQIASTTHPGSLVALRVP